MSPTAPKIRLRTTPYTVPLGTISPPTPAPFTSTPTASLASIPCLSSGQRATPPPPKSSHPLLISLRAKRYGVGNKYLYNYIHIDPGISSYCLYLDFVTSGVQIGPLVCRGAVDVLKLNTGKRNVIVDTLFDRGYLVYSYPGCENGGEGDSNNCGEGHLGQVWAQAFANETNGSIWSERYPWTQTICQDVTQNGISCGNSTMLSLYGNCSGAPTLNYVKGAVTNDTYFRHFPIGNTTGIPLPAAPGTVNACPNAPNVDAINYWNMTIYNTTTDLISYPYPGGPQVIPGSKLAHDMPSLVNFPYPQLGPQVVNFSLYFQGETPDPSPANLSFILPPDLETYLTGINASSPSSPSVSSSTTISTAVPSPSSASTLTVSSTLSATQTGLLGPKSEGFKLSMSGVEAGLWSCGLTFNCWVCRRVGGRMLPMYNIEAWYGFGKCKMSSVDFFSFSHEIPGTEQMQRYAEPTRQGIRVAAGGGRYDDNRFGHFRALALINKGLAAREFFVSCDGCSIGEERESVDADWERAEQKGGKSAGCKLIGDLDIDTLADEFALLGWRLLLGGPVGRIRSLTIDCRDWPGGTKTLPLITLAPASPQFLLGTVDGTDRLVEESRGVGSLAS
ncbi:hypothetical protein BDK51DRAFT_33020 [Blyttiomyces helicus]|uniref:Uncharacterized protein n=1 Tax=Blyttiomyces helicus TaxID=388810 RepID=A0A4P9WJZ3_9FUNG|nr:hypothetical protein BDK51DRAFT_33020 [Blyttiomyces helicus]|eukprot:RKO91858.1 hypothetical protein BDK51DRAFT_33020 [Blyttiomyces helicus]